VRLRGIFTYTDFDPQQLFFQDETGGVQVQSRGVNAPKADGSMVELQGTVAGGSVSPLIDYENSRVVGPGQFPAPVRAGRRTCFPEAAIPGS
jgi:hypothetical protein